MLPTFIEERTPQIFVEIIKFITLPLLVYNKLTVFWSSPPRMELLAVGLANLALECVEDIFDSLLLDLAQSLENILQLSLLLLGRKLAKLLVEGKGHNLGDCLADGS